MIIGISWLSVSTTVASNTVYSSADDDDKDDVNDVEDNEDDNKWSDEGNSELNDEDDEGNNEWNDDGNNEWNEEEDDGNNEWNEEDDDGNNEWNDEEVDGNNEWNDDEEDGNNEWNDDSDTEWHDDNVFDVNNDVVAVNGDFVVSVSVSVSIAVIVVVVVVDDDDDDDVKKDGLIMALGFLSLWLLPAIIFLWVSLPMNRVSNQTISNSILGKLPWQQQGSGSRSSLLHGRGKDMGMYISYFRNGEDLEVQTIHTGLCFQKQELKF